MESTIVRGPLHVVVVLPGLGWVGSKIHDGTVPVERPRPVHDAKATLLGSYLTEWQNIAGVLPERCAFVRYVGQEPNMGRLIFPVRPEGDGLLDNPLGKWQSSGVWQLDVYKYNEGLGLLVRNPVKGSVARCWVAVEPTGAQIRVVRLAPATALVAGSGHHPFAGLGDLIAAKSAG